MNYTLEFLAEAQKEWDKLDSTIRKQFAKKLRARKNNPRVAKDKLNDMPNCYKIKLRSVGYRLIYYVCDTRIIIQVIAIGKRDKEEVYHIAAVRII